MQITVDDMLKYTTANNIKLLSNYQSDFWSFYLSNSVRYDKTFRRLFYSFKYFMQNCNSSVETVVEEFVDEVYNHLLINDKKYSELYRIYVLEDADYSLTDNYDITETMDKTTKNELEDNFGSRSDSSSNTIGEQTTNSTDKVAPYDSENFYNNSQTVDVQSSRTDNNSLSKGSQKDTHVNDGTEEYTMRKHGNIGVTTITDMLNKHEKFWSVYDFYTMIFNNIAKELLIV